MQHKARLDDPRQGRQSMLQPPHAGRACSSLHTPRTCVTAVTAKPSVLAAAITLALCFSAAHTTLAMASDAACCGSAAAAVAAAVGGRAGGRWAAELKRSAGLGVGRAAQMMPHVFNSRASALAGGRQRARQALSGAALEDAHEAAKQVW